MSPIDTWDEPGAVFTGGPDSAVTVVFVVLAALLLVGFFVRMILHENSAYRSLIQHQPVEPGPVVEGEPPVF